MPRVMMCASIGMSRADTWPTGGAQAGFPYDRLVDENRQRHKMQPEFEFVDIGIFDEGRHFDVVVENAKVAADDILVRISVSNRGPEAAPIEVAKLYHFDSSRDALRRRGSS